MRFLMILIMLLITSCASNPRNIESNSWLAKSKQQLEQAWGAPNNQSSLSDGTEIYTYLRNVVWGIPDTCFTCNSKPEYSCTVALTLRKDWVVKQSQSGNNCDGTVTQTTSPKVEGSEL